MIQQLNLMKNISNILVFKTSVSDEGDVNLLRSALDFLFGTRKWSFDLDDCDKVLRVEVNENNRNTDVPSLLTANGYSCEEM